MLIASYTVEIHGALTEFDAERLEGQFRDVPAVIREAVEQAVAAATPLAWIFDLKVEVTNGD